MPMDTRPERTHAHMFLGDVSESIVARVEVKAPGKKSDRGLRGIMVELWIQKGDCELEAKGSFEREGIGHYVWGDDVGIDPSQGAHKRLRAGEMSHGNQE